MENLHRLKNEALIDMLSAQTDAYFRMQAEGGTEKEFFRCKLLIRAIQKELDLRKRKESGLNPSNEQLLLD